MIGNMLGRVNEGAELVYFRRLIGVNPYKYRDGHVILALQTNLDANNRIRYE